MDAAPAPAPDMAHVKAALAARIQLLKQQKQDLKNQARHTTKLLKNALKKRARLMKLASGLAQEDLVTVLAGMAPAAAQMQP